jgi:hypothetical protein
MKKTKAKSKPKQAKREPKPDFNQIAFQGVKKLTEGK